MEESNKKEAKDNRANDDFHANLNNLIQLCNTANLAKDAWTLQEATTVGTILTEFKKLNIK